MVFAPDVFDVDPRGRQFQPHVAHGVRDDLRDSEVPKPLVVRRDDVPRRVARAGLLQGVLERGDVLRPELALGVVGLADLPVPRRIVQPFFEWVSCSSGLMCRKNFKMCVPFAQSIFSK